MALYRSIHLPSLVFFSACSHALGFHFQVSPLSNRRAAGFTELSSSLSTTVDIAENAPRDLVRFDEWATNCGVQRCDGFELTSENGVDVSVKTNQDIAVNSPLLSVPENMILTGTKAKEELGADASAAEFQLLTAADRKLIAPSSVAQFYLFLKILKEYELGEEGSPWYPWLNSLPRYYSNGASMTDFCFGCLPPYAAERALEEKLRQGQFFSALSDVPFLSSETRKDFDLSKWAYSVVQTRYLDMPNGDICLVPMVDFFDHNALPEAYVTYDEESNCRVYATRDISAGDPLRISYGHHSNPSALMARYGFLDESSTSQFCKVLISDPSPELVNMGYDHSRMLFYNTGEIAEEVWDVMLYQELKGTPEEQQAFYTAHMTGDVALKQSYHERYFPQTLAALQKHVDYLLTELEQLSELGSRSTVDLHPRLPLILKHNKFVRNTFERVKENLDNLKDGK